MIQKILFDPITYLKEIIESISTWANSSVFIYPILLSLISAFVFWLVFSYLPKNKRYKKIRPIVELELVNCLRGIFTIFDLIMSHREHSPSDFQSSIRSGMLTKNDIKLGLQNKCLNSSYFYDDQIQSVLLIIGPAIYDYSSQVDYLIDKIISFSEYANAEEILLLEEIRAELRKYDFGEENIKRSARNSINGNYYFPAIPAITYRLDNFYTLYGLFIKLQELVLFKNKYYDRGIFLTSIQYLFYSKSYEKCQKLINAKKAKFKEDNSFYDNYYALCEYHLEKTDKFYQLIDLNYKTRPYNGSLVSSRGFLKDFINDNKVIEILSKYHSVDEINALKNTVKADIDRKESFTKANIALSEYYAKKDTRLSPVEAS